MPRAGATASTRHIVPVGHWYHCKLIYQTQEITLTIALPVFAHWPYPSAVNSNRVMSRNGCETFEGSQRDTASEDKASLSLAPAVPCIWCPLQRMPCRNVSSSTVQPSRCFHPRCWVPAEETPPGSCHCPWPQRRFQNQVAAWEGTFLPEEDEGWHKLQGEPPGVEGEVDTERQGGEPGYQGSFDTATEFLKRLTWCFLLSL